MNLKQTLTLIISIFLLMHLASAIETEALQESVDNVKDTGNKIIDTKDTLTNPDSRTEYLKAEWTKLLEKTEFGQRLLKINAFFAYFNPLYKVILGVDYSLSWEFIFGVIIWIILVRITYIPVSSMLENKPLGLISGIVIASIIGISGTIKRALETLAIVVTNRWIAYLCLGISIVIVIVINKYLGKYIKLWKKKEKEEKTNMDREIISTEAKVAEESLKSQSKKK